MDYSIGKIGAKAASAGGMQQEGAKTAPSKFDAIRSDLAGQLASQLQVPEQTQLTAVQRTALENDLRLKLQDSGPEAVLNSVHQQASAAAPKIDELKHAVARLPEVDALAPLRDRVKSIEADFLKSGDLLKRLSGASNPQELLNVQMQLYGMTQNLEIMSKVVDQLSSGIKTILQTHVG